MVVVVVFKTRGAVLTWNAERCLLFVVCCLFFCCLFCCFALQAVNKNVADLAGRARQGKLAPEEYNGGSFTISNLGMFGIKEFTAVINPPQACILAVGGGTPTAGVGGNGTDLEKDTVMTVVLSADRRVVDDHIAAQFLQVFKTYCEQPSLMSV